MMPLFDAFILPFIDTFKMMFSMPLFAVLPPLLAAAIITFIIFISRRHYVITFISFIIIFERCAIIIIIYYFHFHYYFYFRLLFFIWYDIVAIITLRHVFLIFFSFSFRCFHMFIDFHAIIITRHALSPWGPRDYWHRWHCSALIHIARDPMTYRLANWSILMVRSLSIHWSELRCGRCWARSSRRPVSSTVTAPALSSPVGGALLAQPPRHAHVGGYCFM